MQHWNSLTETQRTALYAEQDSAEIRSVDLGVRRFREQCARTPKSQWSAGRQLLASSLDDVVDGIERARIRLEQGRALRGAKGWGIPFLVMDPGVLALATMGIMLDGHNVEDRGISLAQMITRVGSQVEAEYHMMMLRTEAPKLKAVMDRRLGNWTKRALARARERMGDLGRAWPLNVKRHTASKLISIVMEETDLFVLAPRRLTRTKTVNTIRLSDTTVAALSKTNEQLELNHPVCMPMVVPPNDWSPTERGGYRLLSRYYDVVIRKNYENEYDDPHSEAVYSALNRLQRTEWRINTDILDTMSRVWEAGGGWAGIPALHDASPPRPYPKNGTPEAKKAWKQEAAIVHQRNARMVGRRLSFLRCLSQAEDLKDRVFYFPYRFDFRGRVYPLATHLHPQSHDVGRALLRFANPRPLGPRGMHWLLVHYANCCGHDKVSFDDRARWAKDRILTGSPGGLDPLDLRHLWVDADDPWQALAALMEIERAWAHPEGVEAYPSSLPVSMDGSNSGLQHYSAMLRDPEAGRLVNLLPSDRPMDIYEVVASKARRAVEQDAKSGQSDTTIADLPQQWLDQGITRKTGKRPCMTFVYGVTLQGMKDALVADGFLDWTPQPMAAVKYIAAKLWAAITDTVTCASEAMDWLRGCAKAANRAGVLLHWTTPDGFHVRLPYMRKPSTRISCLNCEVTFYDPGEDCGVSEHQQVNGLAPNFVHSYDGTHLRMTLNYGWEVHHIRDWMMIHDSFGTHACDVDHLLQSTKAMLVELYRPNRLEEFRRFVIRQTGTDPGPPPAMGTMNLEDILDSSYVFS